MSFKAWGLWGKLENILRFKIEKTFVEIWIFVVIEWHVMFLMIWCTVHSECASYADFYDTWTLNIIWSQILIVHRFYNVAFGDFITSASLTVKEVSINVGICWCSSVGRATGSYKHASWVWDPPFFYRPDLIRQLSTVSSSGWLRTGGGLEHWFFRWDRNLVLISP